VDEIALERARDRIASARRGEPAAAELEVSLERAREGLEVLAAVAAELESSVPDRLSDALREGMRDQVVPVARAIAEVRGLSGQQIRRLERLQADLDAERRARVEDLALLVDLVSSGWQAVERRLDRLERSLDRLERMLDRPEAASVHPIGARPGA
jgi:hypothetical protein